MPFLQQLTNLKELNLEDNYLETLPDDLSHILPNLQKLNLNGNNFDEDSVSFFENFENF